MEQLCPETGRRNGIYEHAEHREKGNRDLLHATIGNRHRRAIRSPMGRSDERPEADEHALRPGSRRGNHTPMAAQHREVEVAVRHPDDPFANPSTGHLVLPGNLRDGHSPNHLGQRVENIAHVVGLARQNIAGKNPLPGIAGPATGQPHHQVDVAASRVG